MSNVLPLPAQKELWKTQRARFITVFALLSLGLAFIAMLALVPSFAALEANTVSSAEIAAQSGTAADGLKAMMKTQALLNVVAPVVTSTSSPERAIEHALSLKPKGIVIEDISYVGVNKQIQLSGTGAREALTAYRVALESDHSYTSVSVPVGALFDNNGQFTITLSGSF